MAPINPISSIAPVVSANPAATGATTGGASFSSVLSDAIGRVNQSQQDSATAMDKFMSGEDEEVHRVALATQQAELSFDLFLQIRNKVTSAYQEVMRMQM
jgi:flagellar hook-basal body complex protein FliE